MSRHLYTLLYAVLMPLILLRLLWRSVAAPAYRRRIGERFGRLPDAATGHHDVIWLHAVSVGEVIAAIPLIKALQHRYPAFHIHVSTMTLTGSERVRSQLGDTVSHSYAPYDLPYFLHRFLRRLQPTLLITMETELWPNTVHCCHQSGVKLVLANGRMSARSARGYRRFASLTTTMLQQFDQLLVQSRQDARRFLALGADRQRVQVCGSIKFDVAIEPAVSAQVRRWRQQWFGDAERPVLIAASTHAGEDEQVLAAFRYCQQQLPDLLLILVPRHPERFDQVAELAAACAPCQRLSAGDAVPPSVSIVLGDTMGDLMSLYGLADVAFIGGSLVPRGGHNMLEAALWQLPIVTGSSDFNFRLISRELQACGALQQAQDQQQLNQLLLTLLQDPQQAQQRGTAAANYLQQRRGSLQNMLVCLQPVLSLSDTGADTNGKV